jgi:hypothetical protein
MFSVSYLVNSSAVPGLAALSRDNIKGCAKLGNPNFYPCILLLIAPPYAHLD